MKKCYDIFGNYTDSEKTNMKQSNVKQPQVEKFTNNKNIENFADVSSDIKTAINQIYQADVEAIRNLSNVATKLQNGSLTVPGPMVTNNLQLATGQWGVSHKGERHSYIVNDDTNFKKLMIVGNNTAGGAREVGIWDNLTVNGTVNVTNGGRYYGNRHFFNDAENCGNLRVGCAWGIPGIYSEDGGKDLVLGAASGNVKVQHANLLKSGGNNWIFHTPNDGRRTMWIAPSTAYNNEDWNWGKAFTINENGEITAAGRNILAELNSLRADLNNLSGQAIRNNDLIAISNRNTSNHTSGGYVKSNGYISVCGNADCGGYDISLRDRSRGDGDAQWRIEKL